MRKLDIVFTIAICMMWGLNFAAIKFGLETYPAFLLAALRFAVAALAVLIFPVPIISWRWLVVLGLIMFVGQFGFLYAGIHLGMPAGMASVLMQMQVFLTVIFGGVVMGEKVSAATKVALIVSFAGLVALVSTVDTVSMTWLGLALTLSAATCWAIGNLCVRRLPPVPMSSLVAWLSLIPPVPLLVLSMIVDGPSEVVNALQHPTWAAMASILFQAAIATIFCYGGWSYLIARYGATTVAPFALSIPISGLAFGWVLLGEVISPPRAVAITLIFVGLLIHMFSAGRGRISARQSAQ